uniref:PHP domain-containing protein n=1 Tax=Heligmosomoides polygyrus TaxID=6339 RepID=A0A183FN46_HELPZ
LRTDLVKCNYTFFLLHSNDRTYERVPLQEALNDGCDGIEFGDSVLLIEKTDTEDNSSLVSIGTYSRELDRGQFVSLKNEKTIYKNFLSKIASEAVNDKKFEAFCTRQYS